MFDYKLLEALATVVEARGFEKASEELYITQSAVSQRVKLLEEQSGQILITRQNPPIPTEAGKKLIKHYNQVKLLETEFLDDVNDDEKQTYSKIKIGINADSLSMWFLTAIRPFLEREKILIDLIVDDQDETKNLLKNGEVSGCISSSPSPVQGCSVTHIGKIDYLMVCTKNFFKTRFDNQFSIEKVCEVPAVLYNTKDNIHSKYLERLFDIKKIPFPAHYVPSIENYLEMITMELAYGVVHSSQFIENNNNGSLIEMTNIRYSVDLYWHRWNIHTEIFDELNRTIMENGKKLLEESL